MDFATSALILAWVAILVLAFAMAGLLRQVRVLSASPLTREQAGLPVGAPAPPLRSGDAGGRRGGTIALFLDKACDACTRRFALAEELVAGATGSLHVLALFPEDAGGLHGRRLEVVEHAEEAFTLYKVPATPFGVVIGDDGRIAHAAPLGSDQMLELLITNARNEGTDHGA